LRQKCLEAAGDEPKKMASAIPRRKRFGTVEEQSLKGGRGGTERDDSTA
jgi:hypothetical protein